MAGVPAKSECVGECKDLKKSKLTTLQNAKEHIEKGQKNLGELWDDHSSQRDIKGQNSQKISPNERRCEM